MAIRWRAENLPALWLARTVSRPPPGDCAQRGRRALRADPGYRTLPARNTDELAQAAC